MRIAIVRLSSLGDIVHTMVALQFIHAHDPTIDIDWVVEENYQALLIDHPHLRRVLPVRLRALKTRRRGIFRQLRLLKEYARTGQYDLIIDAQGLLKSAIVARLLGKPVAGFDKDSIREPLASALYQQRYHYPYDANTIDRQAFICSAPLGFTISREQILAKQPFWPSAELPHSLKALFDTTRKNILLVIGSTWPSRNYPPEHYLIVANTLQQNTLVLAGTAEERHTAERLAAASPYIRVVPPLDLATLKTLIAHVDLVIGNDTGPTHLAWALNRPSITLFGPTPVSRVYQTPINRVLKSPSRVDPYKLDKNDFSIRDIDPASVSTLAQMLLQNSAIYGNAATDTVKPLAL